VNPVSEGLVRTVVFNGEIDFTPVGGTDSLKIRILLEEVMSAENENLEAKSEVRERGAEGEHGDEGGDSYLDRKKHQKARYKKRVLDTRNLTIDYKDPETLERFVSKTGKILPRRMTGATARIQRKISQEIRRARMIGLLAFSKR